MSKGDYSGLRLKAQPAMLFETPIVSAHFEESDDFVAELKSIILAKKAEDPNGVKRSNVGGWHSDTDMLSWGGEASQELIRRVISVAKRVSHFTDKRPEDVQWKVQMWANVSPAGASNHIHIHPGYIWSSAFYVDMGGGAPKGDDYKDLGGEFYFEDPRFPTTHMRNPAFRMIGADGKPQNVQPEIRPKSGDFLMFPSWLKHGVRPYLGDRERISIAMNLDAV